MFVNQIKKLAKTFADVICEKLEKTLTKEFLDELDVVNKNHIDELTDLLKKNVKEERKGQIFNRIHLNKQFYLQHYWKLQTRLDFLQLYQQYLEDKVVENPELANDKDYILSTIELFELEYIPTQIEEIQKLIDGSETKKKEQAPKRTEVKEPASV